MAMVIAITLIAERVSSRFAGVLLGFPLGVGISLFFIGYEQGPTFAAQSSLWTSQGLLPSLVWCLSYQFCAHRLKGHPRSLTVGFSLTMSLCCYLPIAFVVQQFAPESLFLRLALSLIGLFSFAFLFHCAYSHPPAITPQLFSWKRLLTRALLTGIIIVAITSSAAHVGSEWSGIFSAFPATILPVALILHSHYGPEILSSLFRELPMGMLSIVVFSLTVAWSFPILGILWGTIFSYLVAGCYLLFYELRLRQQLQSCITNVFRQLKP
ncbi:hypothetical protein JWJ90_11950 [Desulfobulbus rhabdoformis]|uniref:hypothetical protein n=1 Tax=Desulfobulbus rhabdoformis TaxID=34032 RepID=UPI001963A3C3|nr:hypothetical protein [Desulfobulbus rhabdoformis]MBM9614997.1 hypothetical protein [Desulfobulbus rhabdoformis]